MTDGTELIQMINDDLQLRLTGSLSTDELKEKMILTVNELINHDFERLVSLLYRVDVDENKMRSLLQQREGENAAALITDLIIERQLQKIKSRRGTKTDRNIPDDEKW
ncbi:MAG TPA: hypothetical protein VMZ03_01655 [Chitinophagaceae bacterium]|nr:hypothetical protein [Chitinophagaceae bacterium]